MGCVEVSSRCLFGLGAGDGDGGEVGILCWKSFATGAILNSANGHVREEMLNFEYLRGWAGKRCKSVNIKGEKSVENLIIFVIGILENSPEGNL